MKLPCAALSRSVGRARTSRVQICRQSTQATAGKAPDKKGFSSPPSEAPIAHRGFRRLRIPSVGDARPTRPNILKAPCTLENFLVDPKGHISPIVLRDACKCPLCIDQSDRQRNFNYEQIPASVEVKHAVRSGDGNSVDVTWSHDVPGFPEGHTSTFDATTIASLHRRCRHPAWKLYDRPARLWDAATFSDETSRIDFADYVSSDAALAKTLHLLWRDGLVFLDGVPASDQSVTTIVKRMGPLHNTFYGSTWDVKSVPQAKNVAYTSKHLGFHMDLLYMKDPPGYQFLHTIDNSCTGGESLFADTFHAVDRLVGQDRDLFSALRNYPVRYEYSNDNYFYSDEKPTIARQDDIGVPPRQFQNAQHPSWMKNVAHVFYSPPFVGHLRGGVSSDHDQRFIRASKAFADLLNDRTSIVQEKMESGTCVIFDNLRVVHARNAFDLNSGKRWLKGAYLTRQDFYSKAASLAEQMP